MKRSVLLNLCVILWTSLGVSQIIEDVEIYPIDQEINATTDPKVVAKFLKENNAKKIEFNPNTKSWYRIRIKQRKNWILLRPFITTEEDPNNEMGLAEKMIGYEPIKVKGYSLEFAPPLVEDMLSIHVASKKGKKYLTYYTDSGELDVFENLWFDEVVPHLTTAVSWSIDPLTGDEIEIPMKVSNYIQLRSGEKWAIAIDYKSKIYLLSGFHFKSKEDLPGHLLDQYSVEFQDGQYYEFDERLLATAQKIIAEFPEYDFIQPVTYLENGKSVFKVKNTASKNPWSLYVEKPHKKDLLYPINVDDIDTNSRVFIVRKNGKLGFYNRSLTGHLPCEYDELEIIFLDRTYGCALKKDGKWELYDTFTTEKLVKDSADSIDALVEKFFE